MRRVYLVLNSPAAGDTLAKLLAGAGPWQDRVISIAAETTSSGLRRVVLKAAGAEEEISLVTDDVAAAQYLMIESAESTVAAAFAERLRTALDVATFSDLFVKADTTFERDPAALVRLALASSDRADPEVIALLARARVHDAQEVRRAAIEALGLTQWPSAFEELWKSQRDDPDASLREFARSVASTLVVAHVEADDAQ